jgi:transposase
MSRMSRVTAVTLYIAKVRRYNQLGANGLKDKRHQHPGTPPLLSVVEQAQLLQTLRTPTADGGLWNSRKVAQWISNLLDRPVSVQRGWDYLRSLEFRLPIPRPEHDLTNLKVQEAWKKNGEGEPNEFNSSIHQQQYSCGQWMSIVSD